MSADVYSLTIIIFELFSGINSFPGSHGQIFQAKMSDKKPAIPSDFPLLLIELLLCGWSKDPKERPPIKEFKSALNRMLTENGRDHSLTLPEWIISNKREEQPALEVNFALKGKSLTTEQLQTNAGTYHFNLL